MCDNSNSFWLQDSIAIPASDNQRDIETENQVLRSKLEDITKERDSLRGSTSNMSQSSNGGYTSGSQNQNQQRRTRLSSLSMCETNGSMMGPRGAFGGSDVKCNTTTGGAGGASNAEMQRMKSSLDMAQAEIKHLKESLATEKSTTNMYRERAQRAQEERDSHESTISARYAHVEDAFENAKARVKTLEDQLDRKAQEVEMVRSEMSQRLALANDSLSTELSKQRQELERNQQDSISGALQEINEELMNLREAYAQKSAHLEAAEEEIRKAQQETTDTKFVAEAEAKHQISQLKEDHNRILVKLEAEHLDHIREIEQECDQRIASQARLSGVNRGSGQGEQPSVQQLQNDLTDARAELESKIAEVDALTKAFQNQKHAVEERHATELRERDESHEQATQRLINEHYEELAALKARASNGERNQDRLAKAEAMVSDLQHELNEKTEIMIKMEQSVADSQRQINRAEQLRVDAEERLALVAEELTNLQRTHDQAVSSQRHAGHSKVEELLKKIQVMDDEHRQTEDEWDNAIRDLQRKLADTEAAYMQERSDWLQERQALHQGESEARNEVAMLTRSLDDDRHEAKVFSGRVEFLEKELAAAARDKQVLLERLDEQKSRLVAEQQKQTKTEVEATSLRARIQVLEKRLESANAAVNSTPMRDSSTMRQYSMAPSAIEFRASGGGPSAAAMEAVSKSRKTFRTELPPTPSTPQPEGPMPMKQHRYDANSDDSVVGFSQKSNNSSQLVVASQQQQQFEMPQSRSASRIFTLTGFDCKDEIHDRIAQLPDAAVIECPVNSRIPNTTTHLISSGQLTIKLLSALVKGCWLLPENYITDSLQAGRWLPEADYGMRHSTLPLHNKIFGFTDSFKASRHFTTCKLIAEDGGAQILENAKSVPTVGSMANGVIMCTPAELPYVSDPSNKLLTPSSGAKAMTWDGVVKSVYTKALPIASNAATSGTASKAGSVICP